MPPLAPRLALVPTSRRLAAGAGLVIMALLQAIAWMSGPRNPGMFAGTLLWSLACGWFGYRILSEGRIAGPRARLFLLLAAGTLLALALLPAQTSFICHIALAGNLGGLLVNLGVTRQAAGIFVLAVAYLLFTLLLGMGWCSWACGFGAWDETFAAWGNRRGQPVWLWSGRHWPVLGLGILLAVVLIGLATRQAEFCRWLCPFKLGTACGLPEGGARLLQLGAMMTTAAVGVIGLPLLTGRRFFCASICPFGAWQRLVCRRHPLRITINPAACTRCGRCQQVCPMQAVEIPANGTPLIQPHCTLCGRCLEACPSAALTLGWSGRPLAGRLQLAFVLAAVMMAGVVGLQVWGAAGGQVWASWVTPS